MWRYSGILHCVWNGRRSFSLVILAWTQNISAWNTWIPFVVNDTLLCWNCIPVLVTTCGAADMVIVGNYNLRGASHACLLNTNVPWKKKCCTQTMSSLWLCLTSPYEHAHSRGSHTSGQTEWASLPHVVLVSHTFSSLWPHTNHCYFTSVEYMCISSIQDLKLRWLVNLPVCTCAHSVYFIGRGVEE